MNDSYREFLIKTVLFLEETSGNLFAQLLNLASHNDLPMLRENFEDGEVFNFNIEMFEDLKDENVLNLVKLYKKIENERIDIIKKNKITEDELDNFFMRSELLSDDFNDEADDELFGNFPMFLN